MKFENPPIAEVVIGVQFNSPLISNNRVYDYYQDIKENYPNVIEQQILGTIIEVPNAPPTQSILQGFNSRKLFHRTSNDKLIQIQPNKLMFNWRRANDGDEYPHFNNVLKEFFDVYNQLDNYCNLSDKDNQLEVTYVDHIFMDKFGRDDYNPVNILKIFNIKDKDKLTSVEQQMIFPVEKLHGNMYIKINSATQNQDQRKILRVATTCRGARKDMSMEAWYDLAHNKLIDLFENITTENAKDIWGIKR